MSISTSRPMSVRAGLGGDVPMWGGRADEQLYEIYLVFSVCQFVYS